MPLRDRLHTTYRNFILYWHSLYENENPLETGHEMLLEYAPEDFEWYEERYMD